MRYCVAFLAVAGLATAFPKSAKANFYDGNDIYAKCLTRENDSLYYQNIASCTSYFTGAYDAIELTRQMNSAPRCTPNGLTAGQLKDVVVKYMRDHPENRNLSAATLVVLAMVDAWDCSGG